MSSVNAILCLLFAWVFLHHRQMNALTERLAARDAELVQMNLTFVKTFDGFSSALEVLGRNMDNMQTVAKENFGQIEYITKQLEEVHLRMAAYENTVT